MRGDGALRKTSLRAVLAWSLLVAFASCSNAPHDDFEQHARDIGLEKRKVIGTGFRHTVFYRPQALQSDEVLHVYLGSDGTPWARGLWPAEDPTPRWPLALDLMALDPGPAIHLGRPCYHGLTRDPGCSATLWTDGRYSETVVASMAAAVENAAGLQRPLVLIGYSGGGTLAMLLAGRLPNVIAVVTVAANLNVTAWAEYQGYKPLAGSLNPVDQPALDSYVRQLHFAGAADRRVPPELVRRALKHIGAPPPVVLPDHDHSRGWEHSWRGILSTVGQLVQPPPDSRTDPGQGARTPSARLHSLCAGRETDVRRPHCSL